MCGRFANSETIPVMRRHYEAAGPEVDWSPSWNICPTRPIPVLLGGTAVMLIWSMIIPGVAWKNDGGPCPAGAQLIRGLGEL